MELSSSDKERIQHQYDALAKKTLVGEAKSYRRTLAKRAAREAISNNVLQFYVRDQQQEKQKTNVKAFISAVKKYTDMQQLDAAMLREFIDRIEVSHTDKKSKTREITIVYNFIGAFDFERAKEKAQNTTEKQQRTA